MHHTMKMTLAALASLALLPTAVSAHMVKGPHPGTVTALTYYPSGSFHGAVDIQSGASCGYWTVETGVVGSVYWNVTIMNTTTTCTTSSGNEAKHVWADGWVFRIRNFIKTAASVDKTCDSCPIGNEGNKTHLQQDKSGTYDTSWYSGYTTMGEFVDRTETIGVLD
jgi:hypothetical protein